MIPGPVKGYGNTLPIRSVFEPRLRVTNLGIHQTELDRIDENNAILVTSDGGGYSIINQIGKNWHENTVIRPVIQRT